MARGQESYENSIANETQFYAAPNDLLICWNILWNQISFLEENNILWRGDKEKGWSMVKVKVDGDWGGEDALCRLHQYICILLPIIKFALEYNAGDNRELIDTHFPQKKFHSTWSSK